MTFKVFSDFGVWAGATISSHLPRKTMDLIMFSTNFRVGQGPLVTPTSPKNYENRNVFNDVGGWAGTQNYGKQNAFNDLFWLGKGSREPPSPPKL